ncbi:MAG: hypothetical protein KAG12_08965, partial [Desulfuromusa sp.]|nr:hypothetical protein [Desulfuromusa sp.]
MSEAGTGSKGARPPQRFSCEKGVSFMTKSDLIRVAFFEGKRIRKIMNDGEWWFSVVDIIAVLTASSTPKRYWSDLKRKIAKEGYFKLYDKIVQLKLVVADLKAHRQ